MNDTQSGKRPGWLLAIFAWGLAGLGVAIILITLATIAPSAWLAPIAAGLALGGIAAGLGGVVELLRRADRIERTVRNQVNPPIIEDSVSLLEDQPVDDAPPAWARQIFDELQQVNANLLLSETEREQARKQAVRRELDRIGWQMEQALERGDIAQAKRELKEISDHPESDEQRIAQATEAMLAGLADLARDAVGHENYARADEIMAEITVMQPGSDVLGELVDAIVDSLGGAVRDEMARGDFEAADQALQRLKQRFAEHDAVDDLERRVADARAKVAALEMTRRRQYIEDLMAQTLYDQAISEVEALEIRYGDSDEVHQFAEFVRRESAAFTAEQCGRLMRDLRRHVDNRHWRAALAAARTLLTRHTDSDETETVRGMVLTIEENARLEEVRELRDNIRDMISRQRFAEAAEIARDVVHRFPDTKAAQELQPRIDELLQRAGQNSL